MPSRRQFLRLALPTLAVCAAERLPARAQDSAPPQVYIPIAQDNAAPPPEPPPLRHSDAPIVGAASGTPEQASAWFGARCSAGYTAYDVETIVARYRDLGDWAGMDWFLALAQMGHETGHMSSWWSQRPRRNPAGIGVTGRTAYSSDSPPGANWVWDESVQLWREGVSFPTWDDHGIPAHLGRLLAYALTDDAASDAQRQLIDYALGIRPLPASYRGSAPTICGLNGRWAVPGDGYGERIVELALTMRGE